MPGHRDGVKQEEEMIGDSYFFNIDCSEKLNHASSVKVLHLFHQSLQL